MKSNLLFRLLLICWGSALGVLGQDNDNDDATKRPLQQDQRPATLNPSLNTDSARHRASCEETVADCRTELSACHAKLAPNREFVESSNALLQSSLDFAVTENSSQKNELSRLRTELVDCNNRILELESSKALLQTSLEYERDIAENSVAAMKQQDETKEKQQQVKEKQLDLSRQLKWMHAERKRVLAENKELRQQVQSQHLHTERLQTALLQTQSELLARNEEIIWKKRYFSRWSATWKTWSFRVQQLVRDQYQKWNAKMQLDSVVFPLVLEKIHVCSNVLERGWDVVAPFAVKKLHLCAEFLAGAFEEFDTELRAHLTVYHEFTSFMAHGCAVCGFASILLQLLQAPWPLVASAQLLHSNCDYVVLYGVLCLATGCVVYTLMRCVGAIRRWVSSRKTHARKTTRKVKTE